MHVQMSQLYTPEAINGFGLLQAVQNFGLTGKTVTCNFLHLTIKNIQQLVIYLLHEKFWSNQACLPFVSYVPKRTMNFFLSAGVELLFPANSLVTS